jgi:Las1-like
MENTKKVPWVDWDEWLECWAKLQESPLEALTVLELWSIKESLPVRVECTRVILKVLNEYTKTASPSNLLQITEEIPRFAISMVVTRCVNHLIDLNNNGKFAKSVSSSARSIKLPEFLVDLRHDSTHSNLPNMFLLSKAIQELLNWLYKEYWIKQYNYIIEKAEKVIKDIDRFEKRARSVQDNYTLANFAEGLFNTKIEHNKKKTGIVVADLRWKMNDEAWALMFLKIQQRNHKFGESVIQGLLYMFKKEKISAVQLKNSVQEVITLSPGMCLCYTPCIKHLLVMQNTDQTAYEILEILLKANVFPIDMKSMIEQIHSLSLHSQKQSQVIEIKEVPVKAWRKLSTWSARPIGVNYIFTDNS